MKHHDLFGRFTVALFVVAACGDAQSAAGDGGSDDLGVRGLRVSVGDRGDGNLDGPRANVATESVLDEKAEECTAIRAPATAALPHVSAGGDSGNAVVSAVNALLGAQEPPIAVATSTIVMQSVSCSNVITPNANGFGCTFDVSIDGGAPVTIATTAASDLAVSLFDALAEAGADDCNDFAHGNFIHLSDVTMDIASGTVDFDDGSNYAVPPSPNVRATGAEGSAVLAAMEGASINDCDPTRTVFIVCNKSTGNPGCSATFYALVNVGGSELIRACLPPIAVGPTVQLGAAEALTLWDAIIAAAAVSGYVPLRDTLSDVTVINARHFTWDGATVGFLLTADNATPPPPPPPR